MRCARPAICSATVAAVALWSCAGSESSGAVSQPIDFSHQRHLQAKIDCLTCHEKAADAVAATLPPLRVCAKCHKKLQGTDVAREQPIVDAVTKKQQPQWIQVNRLPGHAYFSHRAHVGFAEMECSVCHGDMTKRDHALDKPNIAGLDMKACMSCHEKKGANMECLTCHK